MKDTIILFLRELVQVGPADLLLIGLIAIFLIAGTVYWMMIEKDCSKLRASIGELQEKIQALKAKENRGREELQKLLNTQNDNMTRINHLKKEKAALSRMPVSLDRELEDLVAWCHSKNIAVDFGKRQAARRAAPPGRRL